MIAPCNFNVMIIARRPIFDLTHVSVEARDRSLHWDFTLVSLAADFIQAQRKFARSGVVSMILGGIEST